MTPDPPTTPREDDGAGDDEEMLNALRRAVRLFDAPPASLADQSRTLLAWRDPDAELATLVDDSRELAGAVRGDSAVLLRFVAGRTVLTIEIGPGPDAGYRLVGQIEPGVAGRVDIRGATGTRSVACDVHGRFQADEVSPGPLSLRWTPDGSRGGSVGTPWLLL